MGIPTAFDMSKADFSRLGSYVDENIFIAQVLHKTCISVDERGTKAGAVTVVENNSNASLAEPKEVFLDRPFVYMIIDGETKLPLFIGTVMDIKK